MIPAAGCANRVVPPDEVVRPATVYVADHGKHSSLLLPDGRGDGYVEYAFGDWQVFALNQNTWHEYLRAALVGGRSTLGREPHPTTRPTALARRIAARLTPVRVERADAEWLRTDLDAYFAAQAQGAVDNRLVDLTLVPDDGTLGRYSVLNQCNTATARWLRRLGCRVSRPAIFSDFRVAGVAGPAPSP